MQPWRPVFELNLEGYPDRRFLDIVAEVRPEQCTLVPDSPEAFTSEEGWKLDAEQHRLVDTALNDLKPLGCRVILFIDPDPAAVAPVHNTGADGIEIYTGSYAAAFRRGDHAAPLRACAAAAERAAELGLVVNIGHDLNLENLPPLIDALPAVAEASIGHELTADALVMGFGKAVQAYKAVLGGRTTV
jgi:pyridoxine 5-phosphate synthase